MIRWINDYIGTAPWEHLKSESDIEILDVRDLVDKPGNSIAIIKKKISKAVKTLKQGKKIVVCCDYGISRSNAVAAGIIKIIENIPFDDAIQKVIISTGEKSIKLEVLNAIRKAVEDKAFYWNSNIKRILITGSTGFIGKALKERIKDQFEVFSPTSEDLNIVTDVIKLDSYIKNNAINTIIHLAKPRI